MKKSERNKIRKELKELYIPLSKVAVKIGCNYNSLRVYMAHPDRMPEHIADKLKELYLKN